MQVFKFRNCLLNTVERSVIKDHEHVDLTTKTFDVLQYLIENAGRIVSKDEILGHVWNGDFVEESNLPVHISKLRRALGDSKTNRFIETVQGTGYRFIAPVSVAERGEWQRISSTTGAWRAVFRETSATPSIAILPLLNDTASQDNDYVADGLTEGLLNGLSQFPSLRVIARNTVFRYKNKDIDISEVASVLGASWILTGRIRRLDQEITLGVELIRAKDSAQIWGTHYQRDASGFLELQEEIILSVAEVLGSPSAAKTAQVGSPLTRDPESYRLYLKGRYHLERHSAGEIHRAIQFFYQSLALDPENICALTEVVECYRTLYTYDYISYAEFLENIDPILTTVARGNNSIDAVQIMFCDLRMLEWKFDDAAHHCRKALAINPNSLKGLLRCSDLLLQSRNFSGALEQLEKIMIIDPLSVLVYKRVARVFYMMGEPGTALSYLNDALDLEPDDYEALALRAAVYIETGEFDLALRDCKHSLRSENHPDLIALRAVAFARQGKSEKALNAMKELNTDWGHSSGHSIRLAYVCSVLGKKNEAFDFLESALERRDPDLRALTYDRRWSGINSDRRFHRLVQRIGLPSLQK